MDELPEVPVRATQSDGLEVRDLDRCLRALPPEQREVLLLVCVEELSYQDTAQVLDVPIGTVMRRCRAPRTAGRAAARTRSSHCYIA